MADERLTIREAALRLGVSEGAIRKRVERGTLRSEKGADGRVRIYLSGGAYGGVDEGADAYTPHESNALISALEERVASLERQMEQANERDRENRRLLAAALERIPPALEAPAEARTPHEGRAEGPQGAAEGGDRGDAAPEPERPAERRSWWREFFGFGG